MTATGAGEAARRVPLARLLLQRFRWLDRALLDELAARGWPSLTHALSLVMASIPREGIRPARLAEELGVTRQSLHQSLGELRAMGLIESVRDPGDRRSHIVRLTPSGRANVAAALEAFDALEASLAERIGAETVATLRRCLQADWGPPPVPGEADSQARKPRPLA